MPANAPSRKTGSLTFSIALVQLSLDLYSGTEESATRRSTFIQKANKDDEVELHPVGMTTYDKITGENVSKADVIKCMEASDGTLVPVSDEELQGFLAENGTTEFLGFIDREDYLANYVPEKRYQVRPAKVKVGSKTLKESPYTKPFAAILTTMRQNNKVGLLRYVSRGNARNYALQADGTLTSLYFDDEVREALPLPVVELNKDEQTMVSNLVKKLTLAELPVLEDQARERINEFVEQKAAALRTGKEFIVRASKDEVPQDTSQDFMAMLEASL